MTLSPSRTVYAACSKDTATVGTSSSVIDTTVSAALPALTWSGSVAPKAQLHRLIVVVNVVVGRREGDPKLRVTAVEGGVVGHAGVVRVGRSGLVSSSSAG